MKTWTIKYEKECECEAVVTAETEAEAREKFERGDLDRDVEICGIEERITDVIENEECES